MSFVRNKVHIQEDEMRERKNLGFWEKIEMSLRVLPSFELKAVEGVIRLMGAQLAIANICVSFINFVFVFLGDPESTPIPLFQQGYRRCYAHLRLDLVKKSKFPSKPIKLKGKC